MTAPLTAPAVSILADRVMTLIAEDITAGLLPSRPTSFTALHACVDANEYLIEVTADYTLGACDCGRTPGSGEHGTDCCWWEDDNRPAIEAWLALGNAVAELVEARIHLLVWTPGHELDYCPGWFTFHERLPAASVYACGLCGQHRVAQDDPAGHAEAISRLADALVAAAAEETG